MLNLIKKIYRSNVIWLNLFFFIGLALCLRIYVIFYYPGNLRADEIFQYLEPAHGVVFGTWVKTWEWREGIRSWLVPGVIAYIFELAHKFHIVNFIFTIRIICSFFSVVLVCLFYWAGWVYDKSRGACIFAILASVWPDIVNGSIHTAGECLGGNVFVGGVILSFIGFNIKYKIDSKLFKYILYISSFLLGCGAVIRFQFAPAVAVSLLYILLNSNKNDRIFIILCFLVPVVILGFVDKITLGSYFQSVLKNFHMNISMGVANYYGKKSLFYFFKKYAFNWGVVFLCVIFFFIKGFKKNSYPASISLFIIFYHSLISHKEISFIYPAIVLVVFSVGFGIVKFSHEINLGYFKVIFVLIGGLFLFWEADYKSGLEGASELATLQLSADRQSDMCGLGLFSPDIKWGLWGGTLGYTGIPKGKVFYLFNNKKEIEKYKESYNYIIAYKGLNKLKEGVEEKQCQEGLCLYKIKGATCQGKKDFSQFSHTLEMEKE